jgi:hypothetical protein
MKLSIFFVISIHIKFSLDGYTLFFSCQEKMNLCDLRMNKLIYKDDDFISMLVSESEESILKLKEINDVRLKYNFEVHGFFE